MICTTDLLLNAPECLLQTLTTLPGNDDSGQNSMQHMFDCCNFVWDTLLCGTTDPRPAHHSAFTSQRSVHSIGYGKKTELS